LQFRSNPDELKQNKCEKINKTALNRLFFDLLARMFVPKMARALNGQKWF